MFDLSFCADQKIVTWDKFGTAEGCHASCALCAAVGSKNHSRSGEQGNPVISGCVLHAYLQGELDPNHALIRREPVSTKSLKPNWVFEQDQEINWSSPSAVKPHSFFEIKLVQRN